LILKTKEEPNLSHRGRNQEQIPALSIHHVSISVYPRYSLY